MKTTLPTAEDLLFGPALSDKKHKAIIQALKDDEVEDSYEQFYSRVGGFEKFLQDKGVKKGDVLVYLSPNTIALAVGILGTWRNEAMAVPIDFKMTAPEVANVLKSTKAKFLFMSKRFPEKDKLRTLLGEDIDKLLELELSVPEPSEAYAYGQKPFTDDFDALMILTSGTTGVPKGAVHTFKTLIANLGELGEVASLDTDIKSLLPLPVSHIFGLEVLSACLMHGATTIFAELEPTKFVQAINGYKPEIISGVPLMYDGLLRAPALAVHLDNAKILLCGGAPLPVALAEDFEKRYKKRINNGYGSTESKIIALNLDGPKESIGKVVPSCKINIITEDGQKQPEGSEGEIVIDSPHLMKEYFDQPEKTKEVLTADGYKTGDVGYYKDGYLFISGRAKDMIIVAGNKVFPGEVEGVLLKSRLVKEAAVTGKEHSRLGQIVKATLVISDDRLSKFLESNDEQERKIAREEILKELKAHCAENLKRELRPMEWVLRPASEPLPKTRAGNVDKKLL
jgi:long-chain acyl-CoA synthetase